MSLKMFGIGMVRRGYDAFLVTSPKLLSAVTRSYVTLPTPKKKSQWWVIDGEMHEIGDGIPPRERFLIPRDNLPNKKRKQMRAQFMRKTRLALKESEHESWCKQYTELFQELREDWEKLYWNEGYSKKVAQEHARYESEEDDDADFSPNRRRSFPTEQMKGRVMGYTQLNNNQGKMGYLRDKLEIEREKSLRQRAFAPMNTGNRFNSRQGSSRDEPFNPKKFFP